MPDISDQSVVRLYIHLCHRVDTFGRVPTDVPEGRRHSKVPRLLIVAAVPVGMLVKQQQLLSA